MHDYMELTKIKKYNLMGWWENNIKTDLQGVSLGHELDWSGSEKGQVAGPCEWRNETSVSIQCGKFLDQLRNSNLLKKESPPWSQPVSYLDIQSVSQFTTYLVI